MESSLIAIVAALAMLLAHARNAAYETMLRHEAEAKQQADRELREWVQQGESIVTASDSQ